MLRVSPSRRNSVIEVARAIKYAVRIRRGVCLQMKWFRNLYNWVLHWANTRYGPMALVVLAFAESSVFPIPPDVLLIALALGAPKKSFQFAFLCTGASVLGGLFGYFIGFHFWNFVGDFFFRYIFSMEFFLRVQDFYHQNAFWSIFISGFTPIPYKVFTVSAGVFRLDLGVFLLASALGRASRFFLVAALMYKFGPPIKAVIDKYFGFFTIIFSVLLIGGFVLVKYLLH